MTAGPDTTDSLHTDQIIQKAMRRPSDSRIAFFQMIKVQIIQSHGIGSGLRLSSIAASVS